MNSRQCRPGGPFVSTAPALVRFVQKVRFDAGTGCVVWTGGTTQGRGHHVPYGSFWADGRRWFAHRWAARHIHGLEIDGLQVDHCCPNLRTPNTLCVQHVQAIPPTLNRELQWIRTQVGMLEYPYPPFEESDDVPFYIEPAWLLEAYERQRAATGVDHEAHIAAQRIGQ